MQCMTAVLFTTSWRRVIIGTSRQPLKYARSINYGEKWYATQLPQLIDDQVYILGRLGYLEEAIRLMIEKVGDVRQAIDFVHKQNDPHLWDDLIQKSIRNPVPIFP